MNPATPELSLKLYHVPSLLGWGLVSLGQLGPHQRGAHVHTPRSASTTEQSSFSSSPFKMSLPNLSSAAQRSSEVCFTKAKIPYCPKMRPLKVQGNF